MSADSKQLWLLRHGEAEPHDTRPDAQRKLTDKGKMQAVAAGRAFAKLDITFDLILSSPRVRALDTATLACQQIGVQPTVHEPLGAEFDVDEALTLLAGQLPGSRLMVVGHEPTFSQVVYDLSGARIVMPKGGVAVLKLESTSTAKLIALLRPLELAAIGSDSGS